jgi:hypothetical protein
MVGRGVEELTANEPTNPAGLPRWRWTGEDLGSGRIWTGELLGALPGDAGPFVAISEGGKVAAITRLHLREKGQRYSFLAFRPPTLPAASRDAQVHLLRAGPGHPPQLLPLREAR